MACIRHFTDGSSILLWGGGVKKGLIYGKTSDERPCSSIENTVVIDQVHQSIYHALGIHPETNIPLRVGRFIPLLMGRVSLFWICLPENYFWSSLAYLDRKSSMKKEQRMLKFHYK
jgi:hypothetical protein